MIQVDALFELLKELIQDSEGAPSIDEVLMVICETNLSYISSSYNYISSRN
jgi:hypothetical protein